MPGTIPHPFQNTTPVVPTIPEDLLLAVGANFFRVKKGEYVFIESMPCKFYHQLVAGSIRWINMDEDGKEYIQEIVEPGESFGEIPLFDDEPYAASAIANENSLVLRLNKETLLKLLHEDLVVQLGLNKRLSERMRFRFLLMRILSNNSPEYRVGNLLNFMKKEGRFICAESRQIKLTRQQIADFVGLRVETVIRVIRRMHESGELEINDRKIFFK